MEGWATRCSTMKPFRSAGRTPAVRAGAWWCSVGLGGGGEGGNMSQTRRMTDTKHNPTTAVLFSSDNNPLMQVLDYMRPPTPRQGGLARDKPRDECFLSAVPVPRIDMSVQKNAITWNLSRDIPAGVGYASEMQRNELSDTRAARQHSYCPTLFRGA